MYSYQYYRDPLLDEMLKMKPDIDPKHIITDTLPDQIISTFTDEIDLSLDSRDENPYPDVYVGFDRASVNSESLPELNSKDHLRYGYRYLESIHCHDDQDYERGFVNNAVPDGFAPYCSPGDFDDIIIDSLYANSDKITIKNQRFKQFDYLPLPVSSYLHWIPMPKARKIFRSRGELWMEKS
ncbi:hypothetical protein ACOME3_004731 [Neoechinorhynchus agilis]